MYSESSQASSYDRTFCENGQLFYVVPGQDLATQIHDF